MATRAAKVAPRAGVYARISHDRIGDELGVRRQLADCEKLARSRGFTITDRYVDNDVSAYAGRRRPEYERMLADLSAGRIGAVVAWHPDRIYRHPRDLEAFVETIEQAGAAVLTVQAGELDLSTASGRMVARMLGAAARYESEHKAERQRRKHRELAEAGKPVGGGDRPFGFEDDRVGIREGEAHEIRDAVERLIAGASMRSIWLDWRHRGVRSPRGTDWQVASLKRMFVSPRIAGLREHRGVVVGPAVWPAVITPEQHEAVVAILADRSHPRAPARRYLLTGGVLRCGRCGAAMVARPNDRRQPRYACTVDAGGCNRMFHLAEPLEDFIRDAILIALDGPALRALAAGVATDDPPTEVAAELAALEDRRREAAGAYSSGEISLEAFRAADRDLAGRIDHARDELRSRSRATMAAALPTSADELAAWWEQASLDERRTLLALVVEGVVLNPGVPGRSRFDPARVEIVWRA
ncbi:MAG TPA: recombinase family protein [Actinomycetota bacterium]|jgi:DNA invertase Pin-like site-specific DNA recombinase|nr:recombinase family protein [Actinomycetota bacterium]